MHYSETMLHFFHYCDIDSNHISQPGDVYENTLCGHSRWNEIQCKFYHDYTYEQQHTVLSFSDNMM